MRRNCFVTLGYDLKARILQDHRMRRASRTGQTSHCARRRGRQENAPFGRPRTAHDGGRGGLACKQRTTLRVGAPVMPAATMAAPAQRARMSQHHPGARLRWGAVRSGGGAHGCSCVDGSPGGPSRPQITLGRHRSAGRAKRHHICRYATARQVCWGSCSGTPRERQSAHGRTRGCA